MFRAGPTGARTLAAVLLGALLVAGCGRKEDDPVVISLDGRSVKLSQLVADYDRIQGPNHWRNDSFEDRKKFAELVAKKEMLVRHAREVLGNQLPQREQMICDRWFEKEIQAKYWAKVRAAIEIPPAHLDSLAQAMVDERYLRHILCKDEALSHEAYGKIQGGADFVTIGREYSERLGEAGGAIYVDVGWVSRPQLIPEIANVLFDQLTAEGQVSEPVASAWGWHIIQLGGIQKQAPEEARKDAQQLADVVYRTRKMQKLMEQIRQKYAIEIQEEGLGPIVTHFNALQDSLDALKATGVMPDYQGLTPPLGRFSAAERALPLARWSGGTLTVGDFVNSLWKVDVDAWPSRGDAERLRSQIDRRLTRWMLMEEATQRGALDDPELVKGRVNKEDELFLDAFYNRTLAVDRDKVSDADVQSHWQAHASEYQTKDQVGFGFIRFPADLRDLALKTHEQLRAGVAWATAAEEARKVDQRVDFEEASAPTSSGPYPQFTAAAMRFEPQPDGTATITEPLEIGSEWVILRVHYREHPRQLTFEEAEPTVRRDLQQARLENNLTAMLGTLEKQYQLKIDLDALR